MSSFKVFCALNQFNISYSSVLKIQGEMETTVKQVMAFIQNDPKPEIPKIDLEKKPKVSIVIPVFNGEKYVKNVVRSIQFQSLKELEIIFVDDKSTDKSVEQILHFQKEDPRIKLIKNKKNRGILYNRIYGALQSKGEYVAFIDVDDIYINPNILELSYNECIKNKLEVLEFDYFGGRPDPDKKDSIIIHLFTLKDKNLSNKVYYQPEIKKSFFYENKREDLISGIVYDKFYSHEVIVKMAEFIGEDFWNQHFIYMEDFIISFAVARTAESFMHISFAGVYHFYENPGGMARGVYDMEGSRLKNTFLSSKKLGDYLSMWEKAFDLTENEPDSEYFRLTLLYLLQDPDNRDAFARTHHFERLLNLCQRVYYWKYSSKFAKQFAQEFGKDTLRFEVPLNKKYINLIEI